MKYVLKSLILCLILFVFMFRINQKVYADNTVSEIVIDKESGRILHQKNCEEIKSMASTTKVVTAITVIEKFNLEKVIKIKREWVGIEGSSIYLKEGEEFTVKELLYGLMLRSGNDCAVSLACSLSGSIEKFTVLMSEIAKKAGAKNSSFKNPHGLDEEGHYTTAYDLAMITRYAMNNETFKEIVSTKKIKIGKGDSVRLLYNKNKMLTEYEYATGVKTGYTKKSGRCLVSSSKKDGFELICVVLNCPPMFERSKELLNQSYCNFTRTNIVDCEVPVGEVLNKNNEQVPAFVPCNFFYPLANGEEKYIKKVLIPLSKKEFFQKKDNQIGRIEIFFKKDLIFNEKIYSIL